VKPASTDGIVAEHGENSSASSKSERTCLHCGNGMWSFSKASYSCVVLRAIKGNKNKEGVVGMWVEVREKLIIQLWNYIGSGKLALLHSRPCLLDPSHSSPAFTVSPSTDDCDCSAVWQNGHIILPPVRQIANRLGHRTARHGTAGMAACTWVAHAMQTVIEYNANYWSRQIWWQNTLHGPCSQEYILYQSNRW